MVSARYFALFALLMLVMGQLPSVFAAERLHHLAKKLGKNIPSKFEGKKSFSTHLPANPRPISDAEPIGIAAAGAYFSLRSDFIDSMLADIGYALSGAVEKDTSFPEINTNGADFKNWRMDIAPNNWQLDFSQYPTVTVRATEFNFLFSWDFKVCKTVCDSGWMIAYSNTQATDISLSITGTLDLTSAQTVTFTPTAGSVNWGTQGDVEITGQCTSTFCLLPMSDIVSAVAGQFSAQMDAAILKAAQTAAAQKINTIPLVFDLAALKMQLNMQGSATSENGNTVIAANGFLSPSGSPPPFTPTFAVADSVFQNQAQSGLLALTAYSVQSAFWALQENGDFNKVILASAVPAASPVQLNTGDDTLQGAAPGLSAYGSQPVNIQVSCISYPQVILNTTGAFFTQVELSATFVLASDNTNLFSLDILLNAGVTMTATATDAKDLELSIASYDSLEFGVSIASTNVGDVDPTVFDALLMLGSSFLKPVSFKLPTVPSVFTVGAVDLVHQNGFLQLDMAIQYPTPANPGTCPAGTPSCQVGQTCCPNGAGGYVCSPYPDANCCGDGSSCPYNWMCNGGGGCNLAGVSHTAARVYSA